MKPARVNQTTTSMNEKKKFFESITAKQAQGLMDVKLFPADVSEEDVYAELNRLDGKYSKLLLLA